MRRARSMSQGGAKNEAGDEAMRSKKLNDSNINKRVGNLSEGKRTHDIGKWHVGLPAHHPNGRKNQERSIPSRTFSSQMNLGRGFDAFLCNRFGNPFTVPTLELSGKFINIS